MLDVTASRLSLGPTQISIQWVLSGSFLKGKAARIAYLHIAPRLRKLQVTAPVHVPGVVLNLALGQLHIFALFSRECNMVGT
jgi:hypothetical protein